MSDTCEFQSDCIEYKDISYLKIMPICAIHELSIACHDKENKCKYYQVYKQLKHIQKENTELKSKIKKYSAINEQETKDYAELKKENDQLKEVAAKRLIEEGVFINTLDKLRKIIDEKLEKENKLTNTLQDIKTLVTTDYIQIKKQLVQNYDCLDNFMQKIEDKCGEVL